ncbi:DNA-directed RNA polymerase subunit beta [Halobacillus sp. A1]|uniref:DNA-directed RNA polymerase subunit beta n=1 Tax=Halobacillus sp. A1 TaxID=2880262 RepID=UPI0020A6BF17|nr:DNA-directed RNA polymerase subunit beta [Halobacillus sp. A1]MCP3033555.1 DNA-directed RNA polymerase subunit beta [Halobacillus sp. A1]
MATEEKNKNVKQQKKQTKGEKKPVEKRPSSSRRRAVPIWLRIVLVLVLSVVALVVGLMIGYGVIGDGNPLDALNWSTWQHIIDIMNGN